MRNIFRKPKQEEKQVCPSRHQLRIIASLSSIPYVKHLLNSSMTTSTKASVGVASGLRKSSRVIKNRQQPTSTTVSAPRRSTSTSRSVAAATVTAMVAVSTSTPAIITEAFTPVSTRKRVMSTTPSKRLPSAVVVTPEKPKNAGREISFSSSNNNDDLNDNKKPTKAGHPKKAKLSSTKAQKSTTSFEALTAATWPPLLAEQPERQTPMHTLILGTHPSEESFRQGKYYAFPLK